MWYKSGNDFFFGLMKRSFTRAGGFFFGFSAYPKLETRKYKYLDKCEKNRQLIKTNVVVPINSCLQDKKCYS